jgi:hypothetical protein
MEMEVSAMRGWRVYSKNDAAPFFTMIFCSGIRGSIRISLAL